jgi:hypothetical protein
MSNSARTDLKFPFYALSCIVQYNKGPFSVYILFPAHSAHCTGLCALIQIPSFLSRPSTAISVFELILTVRPWTNYLVLRHNGGFYNTCTLKRCLYRKVDFKANATYNVHVSQLVPLQSRIVIKGLYYFILSDQNKLVEIGCSHKKMLVKLFSILNR